MLPGRILQGGYGCGMGPATFLLCMRGSRGVRATRRPPATETTYVQVMLSAREVLLPSKPALSGKELC